MHWTTCIPLNTNGTASELSDDLRKVGATAVIGLASFQTLAEDMGITFVKTQSIEGKVGLFHVHRESTIACDSASVVETQPNSLEDNVLLLFTSGTTGNKRIVPYKLESIITGGTLIATSWKLSPSDVCLNMMPLYHVGGILRQVVAPLLSGGCVICAECFDPFLFWELLAEARFTWYYAAPTMHHVILQSKPTEKSLQVAAQNLRFLANAAGGLSPSLATKLANTFPRANVLPSYGSTECMPITSPPANYSLEKPGKKKRRSGPQAAF